MFDEGKLEAYGFEPDGRRLVYTTPLPSGQFEVTVVYDGEIAGVLVDLDTGEKCTNFRMERARGFYPAFHMNKKCGCPSSWTTRSTTRGSAR